MCLCEGSPSSGGEGCRGCAGREPAAALAWGARGAATPFGSVTGPLPKSSQNCNTTKTLGKKEFPEGCKGKVWFFSLSTSQIKHKPHSPQRRGLLGSSRSCTALVYLCSRPGVCYPAPSKAGVPRSHLSAQDIPFLSSLLLVLSLLRSPAALALQRGR